MCMHREAYLCIHDWLCFMFCSPGYSTLNVLSGPSAQCPLDTSGSGCLGTERTANRLES